MTNVVIVGGGFAGLRLARDLGDADGIDVTLFDERNHHLFQPLLYQVATAGLSPAEIAAPIRSLLSEFENVRVRQERVVGVELDAKRVRTVTGEHGYDLLVLATGARHSYFGRDDWEENAPGLKTLAQATEIRRRVLQAFEEAEKEESEADRIAWLTFVVVGGGPTGVELAGAIGEMSRFTLARDFRRIDPTHARILLVEAAPRILPMFSEKLAARAVRDLGTLGVEVHTHSRVTALDSKSVTMNDERLAARTVLWAAGVEASPLNRQLGVELDKQGRVRVAPDLSLPGHPDVFVAGDQAHVVGADGMPLPGVAPVAMQAGAYLARTIRQRVRGQAVAEPFAYRDRGQMATIGRKRAILEVGNFKLGGFAAWVAWLLVHIFHLVGFKNRLFVVLQWGWAYLTFRRGARLIVDRDWRDHPRDRESGESGVERPSQPGCDRAGEG